MRVFNVNSDCVEPSSSVDVNVDVDINGSCTKSAESDSFKILELLDCAYLLFLILKSKTRDLRINIFHMTIYFVFCCSLKYLECRQTYQDIRKLINSSQLLNFFDD